MKRFLTFTTYTDEDPQAIDQAEFEARLFDDFQKQTADWSDWVWQYATDKTAAIAQHNEKIAEYEADIEAGRPTKHTY